MDLIYPERRNLLVSYPRSGNTFLRYCVEQSTGKKTLTFVRPDIVQNGGIDTLIEMGMNKMDANSISDVNGQEIILEKTHLIYDGDDNVFNKETGGRIVLVLRDFKEAIGRHTVGDTDRYVREIPNYKSILNFYEKYEGDKLVVYYEDFIRYTQEQLKRVLEFIGEYNEEMFNKFISDIDNHKKLSVTTYNKFHSSHTEGKVLSHHVNHFAQIQLDHMNSELRHPLTERYFTND
jgi:hypothetical protein